MPQFKSFILVILVFSACGCRGASPTATPSSTPTAEGIQVEPLAEYQLDPDCPGQVEKMRLNRAPSQPLSETYNDLRLVDIHNHGADGSPLSMLQRADKYGVDRTVLFGKISEPAAAATDQLAFLAYSSHPDQVYPFFAAVDIYGSDGISMTINNLEKGYYGIGEIVGASTYSPETSRLAWKAEDPNAGHLPEIYQLAARYGTPVLLHIDPPTGSPITKLEEALRTNPDTLIIFGHANAYNSPANIEPLLSAHPNLYIDFFAGFSAYSPDSINTLADFVPMIEKYPDRFMVSTDSGYAVGYSQAVQAMYELLDLLTPATACKVAYQNFERILELQLPTGTQIAQIEALSRQADENGTRKLNKRQANELIFELQARVPMDADLP